MADIADIKIALDITNATWAGYINKGVITKQKKGNYEINEVAKQIIRYKDSMIRENKAEKSVQVRKIKTLEKQIIVQSVTGGSGDNDDPESVDGQKKRLDVELQKQKIVKIKHENSVRKKEFMPVANVFEFVTNIASEFAAALDPLVGKIKQDVPDMNARTHDNLNKSIAIIRNNLVRHIEGKTTNELIYLFDPEASFTGTESTDDT